MKNAGVMTQILNSKMKIKEEEIPGVIDSLEETMMTLQKKLEELKDRLK